MSVQEVNNLKAELARLVDDEQTPLLDASRAVGPTVGGITRPIKMYRNLRGHFGKIYAMSWASDSRHLVSASQDGKLIVWNGYSTHKVQIVTLRSSWVMSCAFSPDMKSVASGGLDSMCSIVTLPAEGEAPLPAMQPDHSRVAELAQHEGYVSCCRFVSNEEILTTSGDSTVILWDVATRAPKSIFRGHASDVMSVSVRDNLFVTASVDTTCKMWDLRTGDTVSTFHGHQSDVNSVDFLGDGKTFGSGSDDSTCRIFDTRSMGQLNLFRNDKILAGVTSVCFSKSGRTLFSGYDDFTCIAWDSVGEKHQSIVAHDDRVSCVQVSPDGKALATASWDTLLKIWAAPS